MWYALGLAFKAVAMAMAAITIVFIILEAGDAGTYGIFLAIGLFSMVIGSIMDHRTQPQKPT